MDIIADLQFKTAVIEIKSRQETSLLLVETKAVIYLFENSLLSNNAEKRFQISFAKRVLKRTQTEQATMQSMYIKLRFFLASSNIFEFLFSFTRFALVDSLLHENLEFQMYFCVISNLCESWTFRK